MNSATVTMLLSAASEGDREALERLLSLVYDELRRHAAYLMKNERPGHTLQPTAVCLLPPHEQAAALEKECAGDLALRQEVEALLAHHRDESVLARQSLSTETPRRGRGSFGRGTNGNWNEEQRKFLQQRIRVLVVVLHLVTALVLFRMYTFLESWSRLPGVSKIGILVGCIGLSSLSVVTLALRSPSFAWLRRLDLGLLAWAALVVCSFGYGWYSKGVRLTDLVGGGLLSYIGLKFQALRRAVFDAKQVGQYELTRLLGKGAMGEVYLGQHRMLRRPCAVKPIRAEQVGSEEVLRRFEREVQAMAQLTHPNTVEVYDFGRTEDGTFFYAMEYLPGTTLEALVERHGPLPAGRVVYLLRQVYGALAEAHAKGLVHRDHSYKTKIWLRYGDIADQRRRTDHDDTLCTPSAA